MEGLFVTLDVRKRFALGVDYGTGSVRALVVSTDDGEELASHVWAYPTGVGGVVTDPDDPNLARQNPSDYVTGFFESVGNAVRKAKQYKGFETDRVVGIGVDSTGSTPLPVDQQGLPLSFQERFQRDPAAMAWLWKDHTAFAEADEITDAVRRHELPYLDNCGGRYSSEWFWAKLLRCSRAHPSVFHAAYSWVELADFVPAFITGTTDPSTMSRGICAAGHKAMYDERWGGLPSEGFLRSLGDGLAELRGRYAPAASQNDKPVGGLTAEVAERVGLPEGLPVATGAFDAHHGAVGAGCRAGTLVKIIGTSTCDCAVAPSDADVTDVTGLCGIVKGSIVPGMWGIEAGQSAVGDLFRWFVEHFAGGNPEREEDPHETLTAEAEHAPAGTSGLLALDWNNGNRTVLADPLLTGLLLGQTLHTTPAEVYRALIEATAFGARTIIERFESIGVPVNEVVNCGGIAEQNSLLMQIYADVCGRPMKTSASPQTCALGAAVFAAVVGGAHPDVPTAQASMCRVKPRVFEPDPKNQAVYAELFQLYTDLHDAFGGVRETAPLGHVMKRLLEIRRRERGVA
ncbi:MAG: ribulokinase [Planctomycetota bacterium]